jgi:6-phosphogluconolactonase
VHAAARVHGGQIEPRAAPPPATRPLNSTIAMSVTVYVGSYTRALPFVASTSPGPGITAFSLDVASATLTKGESWPAENASFLALSPDGCTLFSTSERYNAAELNPDLAFSRVESWRIDPATDALTKVSSCESSGFAACHLGVPPAGTSVLAANYETGNVVSFSLDAGDGRIAVVSVPESHATLADFPGANAGRQEGPHAHMVCVCPHNPAFVYVPDLGANRIVQYSLSDEGKLNLVGSTDTGTPGDGPRHMVFHPTLPVAYVIMELHSTISAFSWDKATGGLAPLHPAVSTLPAEPAHERGWGAAGPDQRFKQSMAEDGSCSMDEVFSCAAIRVDLAGRFLYGSNRGHDSIATFAIADDGSLSMVAVTASDPDHDGDRSVPAHPRDFMLVGGTQLMLVANQNSNNIHVFRLGEDGVPTYTGNSASTGTPVCLCPKIASRGQL